MDGAGIGPADTTETFTYFETYTVIALVYLMITLFFSKLISLMEGHAVLDPRAADMLTDFMNNKRTAVDPLSAREIEIIRLIIQGLSNQAIAQVLHISENTIKSHNKEIFAKLDVHNRVEAVVAAKKRGLL